MKEQKKGYDFGYDYSEFVKDGSKNHPRNIRKAERLFARKKRRKLNKIEEINKI